MPPHSSTLAWKIPWMEEPGRLQSMGSLRDTTEWLHFHFSLSCIGEGNGNPLQCSCLENPRDGWAWWALVYGVTQSRTRLKRLSSSSSSLHCWWESKLVQPLWRTVWRFLKKLEIELSSATAKSLQSCPTLCDPIGCSPPGSAVPGILQARTLEWVAISFFNAWKWKVKVQSLSRVQLFAMPWTAAYQAPPSMEFSRQEYRSGVPLVILYYM